MMEQRISTRKEKEKEKERMIAMKGGGGRANIL